MTPPVQLHIVELQLLENRRISQSVVKLHFGVRGRGRAQLAENLDGRFAHAHFHIAQPGARGRCDGCCAWAILSGQKINKSNLSGGERIIPEQ